MWCPVERVWTEPLRAVPCVVQKIRVPNDAVGVIIGKSGATIDEIRKVCCCYWRWRGHRALGWLEDA